MRRLKYNFQTNGVSDGEYFMVVTVKWNFSLFVDNRQSLAIKDEFDTEALDKISITIPKETASTDPVEVQVQPGEIEKVDFLCITSKSNEYTEKIAYKVEDAAPEIELKGPHILIGNSLVALLKEDPNTLKFSNTGDTDAEIEIIIGRKATPPQGGS